MTQSHIAFFIAGMLACGLSACYRGDAVGALEGRPVSVVQIRYRGARVIDEVRLDNFISTKPGDRFTRETIDADVKSLYKSGMVSDVRFLAEPDGDSVRLIAEVSTTQPIAKKEAQQDSGGNAFELPSHPSTAHPTSRVTP